jgi:hypothetical protein
MMSRVLVPLALVIVAATVGPASAQTKPAATSQLGVDVVRLKAGGAVRGAVWNRTANGTLTLVVRREWLRGSHPEWFEDVAARNDADQTRAWEQLRDRLKALLSDPADAPRLTVFLREELSRVENLLAAPPVESTFVWVEIGARKIAQLSTPSPARQRIALWAWNEGLSDVETRDAAALQRELQRRDVNFDLAPPDLSERLPARPQDDREWAARLAVVQYTLVKAFDLQGTGDVVFPAGDGRPVNVGAVFPQLLQQHIHQQMQSVLGELAGRPIAIPVAPQNSRGWLPEAIAAAEKAGVRGFRVTRVEVGAESRRATVTSEFIARVAPDEWRTIWQTTEAADGAQARPELEARIARDPQVKAAFEALRVFGGAGDNPVQLALRMGAATMTAQQTADQRFFEFRDRVVHHLDRPPLTIAERD